MQTAHFKLTLDFAVFAAVLFQQQNHAIRALRLRKRLLDHGDRMREASKKKG